MSPERTLYTVGHSNHTAEALLALLAAHGIGCVVDVRSRPYSRWPQFGRERMVAWLRAGGVDYVWMGDSLGGRPEDPALLGPDGAPDYDAMARDPAFLDGLDALLRRLDRPARVAVLCSEGDPARCHRERLIAPAAQARGVTVRHILRDGTLADEVANGEAKQLGLGL